jgi:hypothetical protein
MISLTFLILRELKLRTLCSIHSPPHASFVKSVLSLRLGLDWPWIVLLLRHCHHHFSSSRLFAAASSSPASSTEPRLPQTAFEALLNSAVLAAGEDCTGQRRGRGAADHDGG